MGQTFFMVDGQWYHIPSDLLECVRNITKSQSVNVALSWIHDHPAWFEFGYRGSIVTIKFK